LIFLTQPTLWRSGLPEPLASLLWLGGVGDYQKKIGQPYYSIEALEKAMNEYNDTLLEVCQRTGVECLDLANALEKDTTVFFDDVHFNESGARKVSQALSTYLLAHKGPKT
jgi:hypothetical protein